MEYEFIAEFINKIENQEHKAVLAGWVEVLQKILPPAVVDIDAFDHLNEFYLELTSFVQEEEAYQSADSLNTILISEIADPRQKILADKIVQLLPEVVRYLGNAYQTVGVFKKRPATTAEERQKNESIIYLNWLLEGYASFPVIRDKLVAMEKYTAGDLELVARLKLTDCREKIQQSLESGRYPVNDLVFLFETLAELAPDDAMVNAQKWVQDKQRDRLFRIYLVKYLAARPLNDAEYWHSLQSVFPDETVQQTVGYKLLAIARDFTGLFQALDTAETPDALLLVNLIISLDPPSEQLKVLFTYIVDPRGEMVPARYHGYFQEVFIVANRIIDFFHQYFTDHPEEIQQYLPDIIAVIIRIEEANDKVFYAFANLLLQLFPQIELEKLFNSISHYKENESRGRLFSLLQPHFPVYDFKYDDKKDYLNLTLMEFNS